MKGSPRAWLSRLKDDRETVRKQARRFFCALTPDDKKAVPELLEALNSGDPVFRYWAARGLSGVGSAATEAVPAQVEALNNDDADFRFWVVTALSSVGPEARVAIPALVELLQGPVFGVRQAVAGALVRIAPAAEIVVPALVETLEKDENEFVRADVVRALGQAGTPQALIALVDALDDRDLEVRRWAAIGLKMLGNKAKEAIEDIRKVLATDLDDIMRGDLEIALSRMQGAPERSGGAS